MYLPTTTTHSLGRAGLSHGYKTLKTEGGREKGNKSFACRDTCISLLWSWFVCFVCPYLVGLCLVVLVVLIVPVPWTTKPTLSIFQSLRHFCVSLGAFGVQSSMMMTQGGSLEQPQLYCLLPAPGRFPVVIVVIVVIFVIVVIVAGACRILGSERLRGCIVCVRSQKTSRYAQQTLSAVTLDLVYIYRSDQVSVRTLPWFSNAFKT